MTAETEPPSPSFTRRSFISSAAATSAVALPLGVGDAKVESDRRPRASAAHGARVTLSVRINDHYLIPVNADVDSVEVIMLSETDDKVNPAGVKGLGELGDVGTNAAVANAIFNATGIRVRTLPIRMEDVLTV